MKRRQQKRKLLELQKWMEQKRKDNLAMSHDEYIAKVNKHEKMKRERLNKKKSAQLNKKKRLMKWRLRKAEKEKRSGQT